MFTTTCFSSSCIFLCLIHRLSKICFGLCKHALIGTRRRLPPSSLMKNVIYQEGRRVLGRFSCAYIGYLSNLSSCNIVVCHRFHVSPQIRDVRQTKMSCVRPPPLVSTTTNNTKMMLNMHFFPPFCPFRLLYFMYSNDVFLPIFY